MCMILKVIIFKLNNLILIHFNKKEFISSFISLEQRQKMNIVVA